MAIVQEGQTLLDVAIQHCGNAEALFDIVKLNVFEDITQDVAVGTELLLPEVTTDNKDVVAFFSNKQVIPASNATQAEQEQQQQEQGINYWAIGEDFVIS